MPIFKAKEYTLKAKYGYAAGSLLSLEQPMNQLQYTTDLNKYIKKMEGFYIILLGDFVNSVKDGDNLIIY